MLLLHRWLFRPSSYPLAASYSWAGTFTFIAAKAVVMALLPPDQQLRTFKITVQLVIKSSLSTSTKDRQICYTEPLRCIIYISSLVNLTKHHKEWWITCNNNKKATVSMFTLINKKNTSIWVNRTVQLRHFFLFDCSLLGPDEDASGFRFWTFSGLCFPWLVFGSYW